MHILLVDDEQVVRKLFAYSLRAMGHEVIETTNGREALEMFHGHTPPFDMIVTDRHMPKMDGMELAKTLIHEGSPPIVMLSGHFSANDIAFLEAVGIPHLDKPFTNEQLRETIERACSRTP